MDELRVPVRAVQRDDLVAALLKKLHAADHGGGGVELGQAEASLQGIPVDVVHVGEKVHLEALDHLVNAVEVPVERGARDARPMADVRHADVRDVGGPHEREDRVLDALVS